MSRLTSKGQVTIPVAIRYALALAPGDEVVFAVESGVGTFRRATALDGLGGIFPGGARPGAHALERLLAGGDPAFAIDVAARRAEGRRLRLPDAVVLDVAEALLRSGAAGAAIAAALRDVLAERAVRVDHPAAVRAAIDALTTGGNLMRAYALARG
jgi:AbrB family looped-hinge helix DNA binding protein